MVKVYEHVYSAYKHQHLRQYKIKVIRAQKHYSRHAGIKDIKREQ